MESTRRDLNMDLKHTQNPSQPKTQPKNPFVRTDLTATMKIMLNKSDVR